MYGVLRHFDGFFTGQKVNEDDLARQIQGGNLPDLIKNGFLLEIKPEMQARENQKAYGKPLNQWSDDDLKALAKAQGIQGYWNMKRETLIGRLNDH